MMFEGWVSNKDLNSTDVAFSGYLLHILGWSEGGRTPTTRLRRFVSREMLFPGLCKVKDLSPALGFFTTVDIKI